MNNPEDVNTVEKDLRDYAWDYFELHANQRIASFNFYIAVSGLVTTGLVASFHRAVEAPYLGIVLGLLLIAFSYIFWMLDARNRVLVHYGEEALMLREKRIKENALDDKIRIFHREAQETKDKEDARNRFQRLLVPYRYTNCFRAIFLIFMAIGVLGIIASAVETWPVLSDWLTCPDPSEQKQAQ
jgi:hypothetical protein